MLSIFPFLGMSQITAEGCDFTVPNLFVAETDEDGENRDVLRIEFPCHTSYVAVKIYNRWGKVVLENDDFIDGTLFELDGTELDAQNYVYELTVKRDGESTVHSGMVAKR